MSSGTDTRIVIPAEAGIQEWWGWGSRGRSVRQPLDHRIREGLGAEVSTQVAGLAILVEGEVVGRLDAFGCPAAAFGDPSR